MPSTGRLFMCARMADNSDINTWPSEIPSVEYSSPKRQEENTIADDKFALAVSIWAVFAGEKPMVDLFSSNGGHMPDLTKITDDDMFCAVVDLLKEGGLRVECPGALARRDTLGVDRAMTFPLSLFDADLDDEDAADAAKKRTHFCAHCFQLAMWNADKADDTRDAEPAVVYPEFRQPRTAREPDEKAVSDYALAWLHEGETSRAKPRGQKARMLQVETMLTKGELEKPLGSAASSATIMAPRKKSEAGSESNGSSFQRTMSHWSTSSFGSSEEEWTTRLQPSRGVGSESC